MARNTSKADSVIENSIATSIETAESTDQEIIPGTPPLPLPPVSPTVPPSPIPLSASDTQLTRDQEIMLAALAALEERDAKKKAAEYEVKLQTDPVFAVQHYIKDCDDLDADEKQEAEVQIERLIKIGDLSVEQAKKITSNIVNLTKQFKQEEANKIEEDLNSFEGYTYRTYGEKMGKVIVNSWIKHCEKTLGIDTEVLKYMPYANKKKALDLYYTSIYLGGGSQRETASNDAGEDIGIDLSNLRSIMNPTKR